MTYRGLLHRRVDLIERAVIGLDNRGNQVIGEVSIATAVPAERDPMGGSVGEDDLDTRDQQTEAWVYLLDPSAAALTGYDRIRDGDALYEVRGAPEVLTSRRTGAVHHVEAAAYRIRG